MNVTLIANFSKIVETDKLIKICKELERLSVHLFVDKEFEPNYKALDVNVTPLKLADALSQSEVLIVIGGDGTVIHSAKIAAELNVPILAVNSGRLGYLSDLEMDDISFLKRLTSKDYATEKRMLIKVEVESENKSYYCLNDAVLSKGSLSRIIDFSLKCEDCSSEIKYRADGIIISTPTGSTAYSLSAGGPVLDHRIESILVTPICPHSLFSRTLMFSPNDEIRVSFSSAHGSDVYLTFDGELAVELKQSDVVKIKRAEKQVDFIRIKNESFSKIISSKLIEKRI